jgi:hypothetical protein
MISLELFKERIQSELGSLPIAEDDEITLKLAMLIEGECGAEGIDRTAAKFGFSRQRYFQLRTLFLEKGGQALLSIKRGPKTNYRRTQELVCQVIRHRFLDPEATTEVIAQKLRQCHFQISKRTVDRVIAQFGLQKKTLPVSSPTIARGTGELSNPAKKPTGKARSPQRRTGRPPTAGG